MGGRPCPTSSERSVAARGPVFEDNQAEIADWIVRESGALRPFAEFQASNGAAEECNEAAALAAAPYGEVLRSMDERFSISRRYPVGVVGVIAPFNAPMVLAMRALAPALALGNAVVLKPDPRTAVCGGVAIARVFEEAGSRTDSCTCCLGVPTWVRRWWTTPGAGHRLHGVHPRRQGDRRCRCEAPQAHAPGARGNSALIILDDVDLERPRRPGAFGSFHHAGQICMASSRHLVHASVADDYVDLLAQRARPHRWATPQTTTSLSGR